MNQQLREEILKILHESYIAIKKEDVKKLKDLSNMIIHSASIYQDEDSLSVLVVIYALSKVYERTHYRDYKEWGTFNDTVIKSLRRAEIQLLNKNIEEYRKDIKEILETINELGGKLKKYVKEILHKASVAKGSRLYEHGLSLGKTAELIGVNKWELMDYAGKTGIADVKENLTVPIERRLRLTRRLFKK